MYVHIVYITYILFSLNKTHIEYKINNCFSPEVNNLPIYFCSSPKLSLGYTSGGVILIGQQKKSRYFIKKAGLKGSVLADITKWRNRTPPPISHAVMLSNRFLLLDLISKKASFVLVKKEPKIKHKKYEISNTKDSLPVKFL